MGLLGKMLSVTVAAASILGASLDAAVPQMDVDGTTLLVNRTYMISEAYVPPLVEAKVKGSVRSMRPDAAEALAEMFEGAKQSKINLVSVSGYRSFSKQTIIYNNKLKATGSAAKANEYVAIPGASEHQLGLAMDLGTPSDTSLRPAFGNTKAGKWVAENAHLYGFIVRYQQDWEEITGYNAEPWHVRFIGKEHAMAVFEAQMPLEHYLRDLQLSRLLAIIDGE